MREVKSLEFVIVSKRFFFVCNYAWAKHRLEIPFDRSYVYTSAEMAECDGAEVRVDLDRFYLSSALSNIEISRSDITLWLHF